jgi:hypothetical protein
MFLGVDSASPVTPALYDQVTAALKQPPRWWARYLRSGGGAATPVDRAEVDLLHARGCAVLLVWNHAGARDVAEGRPTGAVQAALAAEDAHRIGYPAGCMLPGDIEAPWHPTAEYLVGYAEGVAQAGYHPAFYAASGSVAFADALRVARAASAAVAGAPLWVAAWEGAGGDLVPPWRAQAIDGTPARLWQAVGSADGGRVDVDEAAALRGMWLPPVAAREAPGRAQAPDPAQQALARLGSALGAAQTAYDALRRAMGGA